MTSPLSSEGRDDGHHQVLCTQARELAAVSLLSRQEPPPQVRAHLEACPPCLDEYRELAALPRLLAGAREGGLESTEHPDHRPPPGGDLLLGRLMGHVRRRRRRRRVTAGLAVLTAAAAAVAVARLGGAAGWDLDGDRPAIAVSSGPAHPATPSGSGPAEGTTGGPGSDGGATTGQVVAAGHASTADGHVQAQIWVSAQPGGSTVTLSVRSMDDGRPCRVLIRDVHGRATDIGSWTMHSPSSGYTEDVAAVPSDIEQVELVDARTGRAIVDVAVRPV